VYELIGIGFGPSNIALALALEEQFGRAGMSSRVQFFERQNSSAWHPGMMVPRAFMQVPFLKDLVTLRNPKSPYTFLNYLKARGRLDEFVNLRTFFPSRQEFADYLQWVADHFGDLVRYGTAVKTVTPVRDDKLGVVSSLLVETASGEAFETAHLAVATGGKPWIPSVFESVLGGRVFHSQEYLMRIPDPKDLAGATVAVIGSGQSAAEIVYHLASTAPHAEVVSIIRDFALRQIDSSKFINRVYSPRTVDYTFGLPADKRKEFLGSLRPTIYSVIDPDLINDLYHLVYESKVAGREGVRFISYGEVEEAALIDDQVALRWRDTVTGETGLLLADYVVLASGFDYESLPAALDPLAEYALHEEGKLAIERDYRLACRDDFEPSIYLQGFAEHTHGIAETALSLTAYRAGTIAQSITERLHRPPEYEQLEPQQVVVDIEFEKESR
jgi:L-ornithine N5-monooxygenase